MAGRGWNAAGVGGSDVRVNETTIRAGLQTSLHRDQQLLVVAAAIAATISIAAVRVGTVDQIAGWFVGCAVIGAVGTAWYRFRVRTTKELAEVLAVQPVVKNISIARFLINYVIPFGYVVAFDVGARRDCNVAFWTRRRAQEFAAALADAAPATAALPSARIV